MDGLHKNEHKAKKETHLLNATKNDTTHQQVEVINTENENAFDGMGKKRKSS